MSEFKYNKLEEGGPIFERWSHFCPGGTTLKSELGRRIKKGWTKEKERGNKDLGIRKTKFGMWKVSRKSKHESQRWELLF